MLSFSISVQALNWNLKGCCLSIPIHYSLDGDRRKSPSGACSSSRGTDGTPPGERDEAGKEGSNPRFRPL